MRVKIKDTWYDASDAPICVQLNEKERDLISQMDKERCPQGKFCVYPVSFSPDEIREWMNED